jgi:ABC-type multidrug transport system fused ATPase/permease subunit
MTQRLSLLQQAVVAAERVFEYVDQPAPVREVDSAAAIQRGAISFAGVSFRYTADQPVIKNITLDVPAGQFIAIVGHTGSGKSTIASLLKRFYEADEGTIRIDGADIRALPQDVLHRQIAIVQQDSYIVNATILDNIRLNTNMPRERAVAAAQAACMAEWVERLPQQYDTVLAERGANLSTGQRQQVSLARVLAQDPKILILDEATANVDSHTEHEIQKAILRLKGAMTIVMIAHRLSTIKEADRIFVLHRGEIVQQGTHDALLCIEGLYRHLYQLQSFHFRAAQPENA